MPTASKTHSLLAALLLLGCGAESDSSHAETSHGSGADVVVDPVGRETIRDPEHPEPIDELAADLSTNGHRVDVGDVFVLESIADEPGQRLVVDGQVLSTWTFANPERAVAFARRFSRNGQRFDGELLPWQTATHLWRWGSMVVMYRGDANLPLRLLDEHATRLTPGQDAEDRLEALSAREVEERVREAALLRFAFGGSEPLELVDKEAVVFSNACLEVEGVAEFCDDVQTPGWRIVLRHGDDQFVAHVDSGAARIYWASDG